VKKYFHTTEMEEQVEPENPSEENREKEVASKVVPPPQIQRTDSYDKIKDILSLADVMKEPLGRKAFREFLTAEFSVENLNFYECLEEIEKLKPDSPEIQSKLVELYNRFVKEGAPEEINLPYKIKKPIKDAINENLELPVDKFKEAKDYCFTLMSLDSFKRFVNSPQSDFAIQYAVKKKRRTSLQHEEQKNSTLRPLSQQPKKALDMLGLNPSREKLKKFLGASEEDLTKQQQINQSREDARLRQQRLKLDLIFKRQNLKALEILGHDPSQHKLENMLGEVPTPEQMEKDRRRQAEIQDKEERKLRKKFKKKNRKKKINQVKPALSDEELVIRSEESLKSGSEAEVRSDESAKSYEAFKQHEAISDPEDYNQRSPTSLPSSPSGSRDPLSDMENQLSS
jgi:hypothetical protein